MDFENVTQATTTSANFSAVSISASIVTRTVFLTCITILACCGNLLVFLTLYRRQYLLTPSNKLVFSLTLSNFIFSIIVLPFIITSSAKQSWSLGGVWCSITGFITLSILGASMLTLSVISFDRYYAIVKPLNYPTVITGYRVTCIIVLCWVIACCCALPPLFGAWSRYAFYHARMGCMPPWGYSQGFSLFWIILCFILPYCVMMICYCSIFQVARNKTRHINVFNKGRPSAMKSNTFFLDDDNGLCVANQAIDTATTSNHSHKQGTDKDYLQIRLTNDNGSTHSIARDSGIVSCAITDNDIHESSNYFVNLPHTVPYNGEPTTDLVVQNDQAVHNGCSNNNNIHAQKEDPCSTNCKSLTKEKPVHSSPKITTCALVHRNPFLPETDANSLPMSASSSQAANQTSPEPFWNKRKSVSLQESCPPAMAKPAIVHKYNSLTTLNNRTQTGTETAILPPPARNLSRSSNWSRSSIFTRSSHRSKSYTYSHAHYYRNPKKAMCTILCVLGILLLTMGPFMVASMYEVFHNTTISSSYVPLLPDWLISTVTTVMHLTCIYYPLIYGLWNRTVRKEIRYLVCGRQGPKTRRTRILSLTTHLKDLGLSPRLTAAIMDGSATVATIVRPMKVEHKHSKMKLTKSSTHGSIPKHSPKQKPTMEKKLKSDSEEPIMKSGMLRAGTTAPQPVREYTMRLKTEEEEQKLSNLNCNDNNNKYRDREKPMTSLFELSSSDVLTSDVLLPALLYSNPGTDSRVQFKSHHREKRNVQPTHFGQFQLTNKHADETHALDTICQGGSTASANTSTGVHTFGTTDEADTPADSDVDAVAEITGGRLQSSNLIHLEAGEPIRVRKWDKPQMVDYFAQTLAYGLIEGVKKTD